MSPEHKYALPPGLRLRHYIIVRLLGHGGFGLTYLADDTSLDRKVAIKELLPIDFAIREKDGTTVVPRSQQDGDNLQWARDRFLEEGRTLARLHHPSILPIHEIFEEHGTAYIVTAFIEGESMAEWLRNTPHPAEKDLRAIALSLLDALALVHERGYLHRDVKPENILMDRQNQLPILIDFGNARVATGAKTSNLTAVLTKGYAPFEQYQTKGRQGPFTDLYALGAVFYRAIQGAPPEDATDRWENDKVAPLGREMPPGYSREFLATVDKALKMRREDRWQTCAEWKAALSAPEQSKPPGPVPRPSPVIPALATLAALILACFGIGHWIHGLFSGSRASNSGNPKSPGMFAAASSWLSHFWRPTPTPTPFPIPWGITTPRILFPTPPPHAFNLLLTPTPAPTHSPLYPTPRPGAATSSPAPGFYLPRRSPTPAPAPPHRFGSPFLPTPDPSPSVPVFPAWLLSPSPTPTPTPTPWRFTVPPSFVTPTPSSKPVQ